MHMEYYSLTWLKRKTNMEACAKKNHIDVLQVEYQDYLNTKENILKTDSKKMYNIYNTLNLGSNP
jgi:hypothetical protein